MVENNVSGKFISAVHNARKSQEKEDMIVYQTVIPNLPFGEDPPDREARSSSGLLPSSASSKGGEQLQEAPWNVMFFFPGSM